MWVEGRWGWGRALWLNSALDLIYPGLILPGLLCVSASFRMFVLDLLGNR